MIISVDHKGLEWVAATYLSQDEVAIDEIWKGVDQHEDNRIRFNLPSRLIAKTFLFRLIYGGSAYSYAHDPEFTDCSNDPRFWQEVIDAFYSKYKGLSQWHKKLLEDVGRTGRYISISGRSYLFEPYRRGNGEWVLPRTKILNYPVQGLGADIVMLSRILLSRRFGLFSKGVLKTKLINTVHDDIWLDVYPSEYEEIVKIVEDVFQDLPLFFEGSFGVSFNLPTRFEIKPLTGQSII